MVGRQANTLDETYSKPVHINRKERVAVIGTGISGLASAWLLQRRYAVTLFEGATRVGGHTHTVDVQEQGRSIPVDTGFIVYNERNYPLLTRMFAWLRVRTQPSDMSFGVSLDHGALEYAGDNLRTLFAQPRNLLRPSHWQMLAEILRFNRETRARLLAGGLHELSLGEYLQRGKYSGAFRDHYLLPMGGAIWSCPTQTMLAFPASSFAQFFENHGLLSVDNRPRWRTVSGGGREYVHRLLEDFNGELFTGLPIAQVRRHPRGVDVIDRSGHVQTFDRVVLATHANQSLRLLGDRSFEEREILGAFEYQPNVAYLHSDATQMPRRRAAWSSWNYLAAKHATPRIAVTYWMNRLQSLPTNTDYFVTLNPLVIPRQVHHRIEFAHPVFTAEAMAAQKKITAMQGPQVFFAGAWQGFGFHEDGMRSAVDVAALLGVAPPWENAAVDLDDARREDHTRPSFDLPARAGAVS